MDSLCNLCFVFVFAILSCLFLAALWSLAGNGADLFAFLWVMFSCFFCHLLIWCPRSHVFFDCIKS